MEQDILTAPQKQVIAAVAAEPNLGDFYLTGGTALAGYYLYHRLSDDLDFFTFGNVDRTFLHSFANQIRSAIGAEEVRFERAYDRNLFFFRMGNEELKVEFTRYPFTLLEAPTVQDGIKIDSLRDITANKLMAMLDRFEPKDFVDLFFLLQNKTLGEVRADAEAKFQTKIGDIFLGGELINARRIEGLPHMIKSVVLPELKEFFLDRARELAPNILQ